MNVTQTNNAGLGKGGIIAIAIAGIVIVALVGVVGYLLGTRGSSDGNTQAVASTGGSRRSVVTQENVDEVVEELVNKENVEPGYYTVRQNSEWRFTDGKAVSSNAYVENVSGNSHDVYFDVFLAEDEEHAIYESPVIPRGAVLDQVTLKEDLDAGTYNCVMIYHLVDENQNTVDTLRVSLVLVIEG